MMRTVHFCWLDFTDSKEHEMDLIEFLSIKSFIIYNRGYYFYYHTNKPLIGRFAKKLSAHLRVEVYNDLEINKYMELNKAGHRLADLFRFQVLEREGGIYSDLDSICVRSLDDLLIYDLVVSTQEPRSPRYPSGTSSIGMFMANAHHPYLQDFIKEYQANFESENWIWDYATDLSTRLVSENDYKNSLRLNYQKGFFYPNYKLNLVNKMKSIDDYKIRCYAHHLWNSSPHGKDLIAYIRKLYQSYEEDCFHIADDYLDRMLLQLFTTII